MIAWRGVTVRYPGGDRDVLEDVSIEAPAGSLTAVVGPNGSGKSTLVRALLGRVRLRTGRIDVAGDSADTLTQRELARRVAVVVQREELVFPIRTVEYIALGRTPHRGAWGSADPRGRAAVADAAAMAGVGDLLDRLTDQLSGGEWQRVRLARAVAQESPAIVLDEPTTFLDIAHEMAAFELLADLSRGGKAVIAVSHQLNLVSRFADQVILLHRGRVAAAGSPGDVMRAPVLESVYEWPLVVTRDAVVGAPTLVPLRRSARPPSS